MNRTLLVLVAILLWVSACSAPNTAAPTEPLPAPTLQNATAAVLPTIPVASTRTDRRAPTLGPTKTATNVPTDTPPPTETPLPSAASTLAPSATALPSATAPRPAATATPNLAAGVYVTALRVDPPAPRSKPAQFLFRVSFLNTVGQAVNYARWRVLIFPQGQIKAVGDPQGASKTIANGASEQTTELWSIRVGAGCESFTAQPVWEDENGKQTPLPKTDGTPMILEFQVCP